MKTMKLKLLFLLLVLSGIAAAQTTPNLGLNIPSQGTLNWNTLLNTNFSQLDLYLSGGLNLPGNLGIVGNLNVGGTVSCGGGCGGITFGGDLSGSSGSQTVIGLNGKALPSLSAGCLNYTGSVFQFTSCGALTGSGTNTQIAVWTGSTALTSYTNFSTDASGNVNVLTLSTSGAAPGRVLMTPSSFTTLTAAATCNSTNKGMISVVNDSNTVVWGANIAGSSSSVVLAFCDGTNWTVAGK